MGKYTRFVPFGLGHKSLRSEVPGFDRRSKRSFRRWRRQREKTEWSEVLDEIEDQESAGEND